MAIATVFKEFDEVSFINPFSISYSYSISGRVWGAGAVCDNVVLKIYVDVQASFWGLLYWSRLGEISLFEGHYGTVGYGYVDQTIDQTGSGTWSIDPDIYYTHYRVAAELCTSAYDGFVKCDGDKYAQVSLSVDQQPDTGGGGGCPYVYTWNGQSYVKDNNILPVAETGNGTDTRDYYLLQQPLVPVFTTRQVSVYSLQIREFESEQDYIDQVKLISVDHAQGTSIAVTPEGGIVTYQNPASPLSCVDNCGNDRLDQIGRVDGNMSDPSTFFQGYEGDWVLLDFGRVSGANANLIFRDDQKCMEYCINVQVPNGNVWQTVEVLNPRNFWAVEAVNMSAYVPVNGDFIVRLLWTAPHRLDYVGLETSSQGQITVNSTPPVLAIHSTMGDVTAKLLYDDENCVELVNGQQITLAFTLPNKRKAQREISSSTQTATTTQ